MALLEIANLTVEFATATGSLRAVDGVNLSVDEREIVAIVGESGSGKSVANSTVARRTLQPEQIAVVPNLLTS